mmetsp:Transcript_18898/g.32517  ORF Transcript_18898/g.32517 Transcript_18898/m.32517 type:complete len:94 (+) Transcript_18898:267-548(+)
MFVIQDFSHIDEIAVTRFRINCFSTHSGSFTAKKPNSVLHVFGSADTAMLPNMILQIINICPVVTQSQPVAGACAWRRRSSSFFVKGLSSQQE